MKTALMLAVAVCSPFVLEAQGARFARAGDTLSITTAWIPATTMVLLGSDSASFLRLSTPGSGAEVRVDRRMITSLRLSAGTRSNADRGALIGALAGAAAMVAMVALVPRPTFEGPDITGLGGPQRFSVARGTGASRASATDVVGAAAFGALLGGGVGALVGRGSRRIVWVSIPISSLGRLP